MLPFNSTTDKYQWLISHSTLQQTITNDRFPIQLYNRYIPMIDFIKSCKCKIDHTSWCHNDIITYDQFNTYDFLWNPPLITRCFHNDNTWSYNLKSWTGINLFLGYHSLTKSKHKKKFVYNLDYKKIFFTDFSPITALLHQHTTMEILPCIFPRESLAN